jgi:uncharacterized membrane protein YphA (DoxX/SURF4 family)
MRGSAIERLAEAALRIGLGYRFLSSGISNARRWPHATETAAIVSREYAYPLGAIATALMVLGGAGLAFGLATRLAAFMLVLFLLPTFIVHRHWLRVLPPDVAAVEAALTDEDSTRRFRLLGRHAVHAHETGMLENVVYLLTCLFFMARGSTGFSLDSLCCAETSH